MAGPWEDFAPQQQSGPWDEYAVKKDPKVGKPEELSFAERYIAPLIDKTGLGDVAGGNVRGSAVGRLAMGAAAPGVAVAQLAANALSPLDNSLASRVNQGISHTEKQYQDARAQAGSTGFDPLRAIGEAAMTALPLSKVGQGASLLKQGLMQGAASGALHPVTGGDNFWIDKAKDVGIGAAAGGVAAPLVGALARVVSPRASVNPDLQLLRSEGVQPTVGQTLGGLANNLEEKAMSLPLVGDAIRNARGRAVADFNNAAINRAVEPIGQKVAGSGQEAVAQAGDALSNAYNTALSKVSHVNFDTPQFNQQLGQLQDMTQGLAAPLQQKFNHVFEQVVLRKMSPNGSILGADLKAVDSELGKMAGRYSGSSVASEQEFGDAVKQLQALVRGQVSQSNPQYAMAQAAADKGWANLVRVEGAAKSAINNEGVFTPAQLNSAVRGADTSVRDRASARGEALMQDLSNAGQKVLANRVPNSGTTDRALLVASGAGAMAAPYVTLPAAAAGAAAYSRPVQNLLSAMIANRPQNAPAIANYLRRLMGPAVAVSAPSAQQGR
jgi:hypothetical protein